MNQASVIRQAGVVDQVRSSRAVAAVRPAGLAERERASLAAVGVFAAGFVMLVGSLLDVGILWVLQRQSNPQWEYVAVANTMEAVPRLVLGLGLLYAAAYLGGVASLWIYRVLAVFLVLLGLFSMACGALILSSYLALAKVVTDPEGHLVLRSVAIKALGLSSLYVAVLIPVGIWGMRRPRQRAS
jgi:hypothetical protein